MKFVTNGFAPLYVDAFGRIKIQDCNEGTVFDCLTEYTDTQYLWVTRDLGNGKTLTGWMYSGYLDLYQQTQWREQNDIYNATPNPNDAWQFANIFGQKQTNLCGQICAAHVLGIDLKDVLAEWQQDSPTLFANVFNLLSSKKARGTDTWDLQNLFSVFDKKAVLLSDLCKDMNIPSRAKNSPYLPTRTRNIISNYHVIASCRINNNTGVLQPSGTLHWVVLESVELERWKMGMVKIYNPYMGCVEQYSWREWIASAGYPYGVAIER